MTRLFPAGRGGAGRQFNPSPVTSGAEVAALGIRNHVGCDALSLHQVVPVRPWLEDIANTRVPTW